MSGPDGAVAPLALIVHSGAYDRVAYAYAMATAAAAVNRPTILFLTGEAIRVLTPDGWRRLAGDPERQAGIERDRGVASLPDLLGVAADLGIRTIACEMALRRLGLTAADLDSGTEIEVAGLVTLYGAATGGQTVFI